MNVLKITTFFLVFSLANLHAADKDEYTPLAEDNDTEIPICSESITYLENQPGANWLWYKLTGVATLVPFASAVVPGPVLCTQVKSFMACFFSSVFGGIFGGAFTVVGVGGTGILIWKSYKDDNVKKQHLEMAKLISDAYEFNDALNPANSLPGFLRNYQDRFRADTQTALELAEKIKLADQAHLFIPADELIAKKIEELGLYATYSDAPNANNMFQDLGLGQFFGQNAQDAVDTILAMTKEELIEKQLAFPKAIEQWHETTRKYIADVEAADAVKLEKAAK